jgi:hypothetical protein
MTTIEIAKNLLEGKTCDTCAHGLAGDCSYSARNILERNLKSKDNTCDHWQVIDHNSLTKLLLPIVRTAYPNLIANQIVSVQPITASSSDIFI